VSFSQKHFLLSQKKRFSCFDTSKYLEKIKKNIFTVSQKVWTSSNRHGYFWEFFCFFFCGQKKKEEFNFDKIWKFKTTINKNILYFVANSTYSPKPEKR